MSFISHFSRLREIISIKDVLGTLGRVQALVVRQAFVRPLNFIVVTLLRAVFKLLNIYSAINLYRFLILTLTATKLFQRDRPRCLILLTINQPPVF